MGDLILVSTEVEAKRSATAFHQIFLRPYLGRKNGVAEAIKALATDEVLEALWDIPSRQHEYLYWWNAPCFVEALQKLPRRKALRLIKELVVVYEWAYGTIKKGTDGLPGCLLEKILPKEDHDILTCIFNAERESADEGGMMVRTICNLLLRAGPPRPAPAASE